MPHWEKILLGVLCLVLGVFVGLGTYTFYYGRGYSYLSNDPKACVNCHVMQGHFDTWGMSSHHAVATCNDCHTPHTFPEKYMAKLRNGWNHGKAFTTQDFPEPIRITNANLRDLQYNCVECHQTMTAHVAGRADITQETINCTKCHQGVGHGRF